MEEMEEEIIIDMKAFKDAFIRLSMLAHAEMQTVEE